MKIKKLLFGSIIKESRLLGIDMGREFIRLVELSFNGKRLRVEFCGNLAVCSRDYVASIKEMLRNLDVKTKFVAISFPRSDVIFKDIDVESRLSFREIEAFLRFNLAKEMNLLEEDIAFDYQIISNVDGVRRLKALGADRKNVEEKIKLFESVGLKLKIIDIDTYALSRALYYQLGDVDGLVGVVNLDGSRISIAVFDGVEVVYLYEDIVNVGLDELLRQKLGSIKEKLSGSIDHLVLSGFDGAICSGLGVSAIAANPFFDMDVSTGIDLKKLKDFSPFLLASCGLALRVKDGWY